ncbi:MAG: mannose-1-phosphate guanylyltransferase [Deltaproteobacteria bacterium]|nr:mannose-1-phosphate guanylyltransferase [Deltaproteobacteria bacterium]
MAAKAKSTRSPRAANTVAVLLAGGTGTRFWPASTRARPKQLLPLVSNDVMLAETVARVAGLVGRERVLVVTSASLRAAIARALPELPRKNILAEPEKKDTAAAIAWATLEVEKRFGPSVMAVFPSDHVIHPTAAFHAAVRSAVAQAAVTPCLYTFGVPPTHPATGYGYLELGARLEVDSALEHHAVARFVEKPAAARAAEMLAAGGFLWNSGMFVWSTSTIKDELARFVPGHLEALTQAVHGRGGAAALKRAFARLPAISIDKAVMERTDRARCVKAPFSWADVGSFPALAPFLPKDASDNAHRGRVTAHAARDNVVWCADGDELVALLGVEGLVVVRAGKRTLVMPSARAEELKSLVSSLDDLEL